jgi:hypothetical protein
MKLLVVYGHCYRTDMKFTQRELLLCNYVGICKSYKWDNNVVSHTLRTIAQNVKSTKLEFNAKTERGTDCSQNYRNTLATR